MSQRTAAAAKRSEIEEIDLNDDSTAEVQPLAPNAGNPPAHGGHKSSAMSNILTKFWSLAFLVVATLGLHEVRFLHVLLYASHASRPMVNLGIFCCTIVAVLSAYLDYYRAMYKGEKVEYKKAQSTTHAILASMCIAGLSFSIGLWPVWHWMTVPILFMWFWGFLVPLVILLPPMVQKVVFAGLYFYFMHSYLSTFML
ncbi:Aste57867_12654 [Aphanomyces stellatus]|uniref:Aste57867_12654 protein n=1 Tax=Aphanomyces stellatus TaxID=120398 RepID=A0A485KW54_9STRA|nr:hypothetical protein As57867_012608 [Aphanomyces stellatus]VFT89504.1 Aste57867_12654 [Aphanomyces stellatus]